MFIVVNLSCCRYRYHFPTCAGVCVIDTQRSFSFWIKPSPTPRYLFLSYTHRNTSTRRKCRAKCLHWNGFSLASLMKPHIRHVSKFFVSYCSVAPKWTKKATFPDFTITIKFIRALHTRCLYYLAKWKTLSHFGRFFLCVKNSLFLAPSIFSHKVTNLMVSHIFDYDTVNKGNAYNSERAEEVEQEKGRKKLI